jgi:predicted porin
MAFRVIGAVDYQSTERNAYVFRSVSFRDKVEETSYRAELRRSFAEQFTGALAYIYSQRDGSSFLLNQLYNTFQTGSNLIAPLHLADRDRNRVRFSLTWIPLDPLAVQFFADVAKDSYDGRGTGLGLHDGKFQNYSIDATYSFSADWQVSAWYSYNTTTAEQSTCEIPGAIVVNVACPATLADPIWQANLKNTSNAVGLGLRGKPSSRIEIGADLQYQDLVDEYNQFALVPSTSTVAQPLPDINTKLTTIKLWGKYALDKRSGIRVDYIYDRFDTDDWTWTSWVYTDGTTVSQEPRQTVNFLGVSYYYRFQ